LSISGEKIIFFNNQCHNHFLQALAVVWAKTPIFFDNFLGINIFEIITSVQVEELLDDDDLEVSEEAICAALMRWIKHAGCDFNHIKTKVFF
jgi:hypothetical protein